MAKTNALTHSFSRGEVSTAALARVDQEKLRLAAEIQENLFPHVVGKGMFRPGTAYVANAASNNKARMLRFVRSPTETALIECTSSLVRFMVSDTFVTRGSVTSSVVNSGFSTASATITMTIASPAVVTWTSHGLSAGALIYFTTTGALPTGVAEGTAYYVISTGLTSNAFQFSTSAGGAAVNSSGSQSGTHTGNSGWYVASTPRVGGTATIASGALSMSATARGSVCQATTMVTTSNTSSEHAIRLDVTRGDVYLGIGSTFGGNEYQSDILLGPGTHSIAFTPTASPYYIVMRNRSHKTCVIDSCAIESSGVISMTAPWSEADLPLIRYDQSVDVMYLACASWQSRKIERRHSGRSWSLVKYTPEDGPFITANTGNITITPGAAYGSTTLTASGNLFTSSMVGSLVRVFPSGYASTFNLAASDEWSDAIRVYGGVDADTHFTSTVSGTWAGTLQVQRSYDGPDSGFIDVTGGTPWTLSINGTNSHTGQSILNTPIWYRIGFKYGAYTSGAATVLLTYNGGGTAGVYRITAYSSATSVTVDTLSAPSSLAATKEWQIGAWSDSAGWPASAGFFDGRLWWGGKDKFWGTESDDYTALNLDDEGASGSIQRAIATGGTMNTVRWFLPLQRLIMGCDGAEISARSSSFDEPLTPTNVTLKDASTNGVASYSPVKLDGRGFFIQRDGVRLFEMAYDVDSNDYRASSIMLLNETIGGTGFIGLAVQRSPETYVWTVRADGQCPVLLYDSREKTAGWFRYIAAASLAGDAIVEDVQVLPTAGADRVYLCVKRTINGSVVRFVEKLALHSEARGETSTTLTDASVTVAGPVTTVSGLTHLVGETVVAWGTTGGVTGPIGTTYTVNGSGQITLPSSSTGVTVGLAYNWRFKSAKLAHGTEGGTTLLRPKRIAEIGMLLGVHHPSAIQYGPDFSTMYYMPRVEDGQDVTSTTMRTTYDEKSFAFGGGWDTDSRVCLKGSSPYPAELFALVTSLEIGAD